MKILFYSPHALADSSNGAARSVSTLLSELVRQGHECKAVTGSVVDAPNDLFSRILAVPHTQSVKVPEFNLIVPVRTVVIQGVTHSITCFRDIQARNVLALEEFALKTQFLTVFGAFQPDAVLSYGGGFISVAFAGFYAMAKGKVSIHYAAAGAVPPPEQFENVNRVVAVSSAVRQRLDRVTSLPKIVLPPFVPRQDMVAPQRAPEFITFINPEPAKGLKLAVALVAECARRGRDYKFLFVEARYTGNGD